MAKPDYIAEAERDSVILKRARKCIWCEHIGRPIKWTRHKGGKKTAVYECAIHPGCMNTEFSIACDDWTASARPDRQDLPQPE